MPVTNPSSKRKPLVPPNSIASLTSSTPKSFSKWLVYPRTLPASRSKTTDSPTPANFPSVSCPQPTTPTGSLTSHSLRHQTNATRSWKKTLPHLLISQLPKTHAQVKVRTRSDLSEPFRGDPTTTRIDRSHPLTVPTLQPSEDPHLN